MRRMSLFWMLLAVGLSAGACTPPHYSVAVATSPGYITFGQRHSEGDRNDYLVDCAMQPDGSYTSCTLIELAGPQP
ncbi:MAG: hypothetical protein JXB32_20355 [Deltaproteobacteria bacterium]|nr:hypothetical protein [Deltaproteobacteria bacterium]